MNEEDIDPASIIALISRLHREVEERSGKMVFNESRVIK